MIPRKKERPKEEEQGAPAQPVERQLEQLRQEANDLRKQLEGLGTQVEGLRKEKDDIFAKLQRVAADYENYQKRSARQVADSIAYEKEKLIKSLLPVLDDFEHALANAYFAENVEGILKGLHIVYDHLLTVLKTHGVEHISAADERFDPLLHDAMTHRAETAKENGVVLEELQKGYKLNGRVIRASRVIVNKLSAPQPPAAEQQPPTEEPETRDTQ